MSEEAVTLQLMYDPTESDATFDKTYIVEAETDRQAYEKALLQDTQADV